MAFSPPLFAASLTLVAAAGAHAQVQTVGTVRGTVVDTNSKPLAGVTVTLTPSKGEPLTAKTNALGAYEFTGVVPGSYRIGATTGAGEESSQPLTVNQDTVYTVGLALGGATRLKVTVSPVRLGQTSDSSNISKRTEQLVETNPNNLYQIGGLLFGQAGVTTDPGGSFHLKGGDSNQVGYQIDGIEVTEPLANNVGTNGVTVGLKSANLVTGGADASYGNAGSGFINELTNNGRDVKGGGFEYRAGPGNGWNYQGTQIQYGNVTGNGKFDYYGATVLYKNDFPNVTNFSRIDPSQDVVGKLNYYLDAKDTFTAYVSDGRQRDDVYKPATASGLAQYPVYDPATGKTTFTSNYYDGYDETRYDIDYFNYKRSFSDKSFANLKIYALSSRVNYPQVAVSNEYIYENSRQTGFQLDFSNRFTPNYLLKAGAQYLTGRSYAHIVQGIPASPSLVDAATGLPNSTTQIVDLAADDRPKTTTFFLTNSFRLLQDRATLDLGARYSQVRVDLANPDIAPTLDLPGHSTATYVDPRLGASYAPSKTLVFRTSYTVTSTFPDFAGIERLPATYLGYPATSVNPTGQAQALGMGLVPYNSLKASHVNAFDLGGEKGFDLPGFFHGSYRLAVDGFRRVGYDLIQSDTPNLAAFGTFNALDQSLSGLPIRYTNDGKSHASGYDLTFTKRLVHETDMEWNGFATYTHLVSKATAGNYSTDYEPFYAQYLSGTPGVTDATIRNLVRQNEVQTSWDQTHTVSVVANKRYLKFLAATILLDAGSGYPYSGATVNEFTGGFATSDAQHSSYINGGAAFHQVPVVLNGTTLQPISPIVGQTGWHYKFTLNNDLYISRSSELFLDVDNVFNRKTVVARSPTTAAGQPFYSAPTAAYPQGVISYGNSINLTPRFLSFGVRSRF